MNNRIVAVTGASGLIGKVVVNKLLSKGYKLRLLLRPGSINYWKNNSAVETQIGDVRKFNDLEKLVRNTWGVIHLAVEMDSTKEWKIFKEINVDSVKNIIKLTPINSRLVIISSVVVYQDTGEQIRDETWKIKTNGGVDKYVQSKLDALKIIRNSSRKVVTLMPSTVVDHEIFGREQFITDNVWWRWVWSNIGGGIPGGLMAAVGDRNRIMNFVEVNDVAEGVVMALEKGVAGEEYILSGENITAENYLKKMSVRCQKKYLRFRIPNFFLRWFGIGGVVNMNYSAAKAKRELGYEAKWKL